MDASSCARDTDGCLVVFDGRLHARPVLGVVAHHAGEHDGGPAVGPLDERGHRAGGQPVRGDAHPVVPAVRGVEAHGGNRTGGARPHGGNRCVSS